MLKYVYVITLPVVYAKKKNANSNGNCQIEI